MKNLIVHFQHIILVFAFTLLSTSVFGQNLFDEVPTPAKEESAAVTKKIKLRKKNKFNKSVFKINLNKIKKIQKEDGKFKFKIPNDRMVYTAYSQYVEVRDDNNYEWNGEVLDKEGNTIGYVTLSEVDGALFGEIHVNERSFIIEDFGKSKKGKNNGRITYLIEKDTEATKDFKCGTSDVEFEESNEILKEEDDSQKRLKSITCTRNVRVLVLFTTAANNIQNGNQAAVNFINQSNQALRNSGIRAEQLTFQLAAAQLFNGVPEEQDAELVRNALAQNLQVITLRNNLDADVVVLLTNSNTIQNQGIAGIAFLHNLNLPAESHAVVQINTAPRFTFVHEIAHNFGCKHNECTQPECFQRGLTTYARGKAWRNTERTIMAFTFDDLNQTRIQNFSSPNIYFNGTKTGDSNSRDNARQLREQALKISNYEVGQDPAEVIINGPSGTFLTGTHTWCASTCAGPSITNYQWSWSPNGFTYYNFGSNSNCASKSGSSFFPAFASRFYIRVIATFSNGATDQAVFPVTNRDKNYIRTEEDDEQLKSKLSTIKIDKLGANVYPNPNVDGHIELDIMVPNESVIDIEIYNSLGQLEHVVAQGKKFASGVSSERIFLNTSKKGLKYIRIDDGISQEILPVIIQ